MKNKIVAIIPIKSKSKRVKSKNFKKINGIKLYEYFLRKLNRCKFHEVYIDTDSKEIKKYSIKKGFKVIDRIPMLSRDNANGNDLLNYHQKLISADYYFQNPAPQVFS